MDKFNLYYGILRWSMDVAVCIDFESNNNEDFLLCRLKGTFGYVLLVILRSET